jgi:SagB-type dehydrogenase family enzyme
MWQFAFRKDVTLAPKSEDGSLRLEGYDFAWTIKNISLGMEAVLRGLKAGEVAESQLLELVMVLDGPNGIVYLSHYLKRLSRLICYTLIWDGQRVATLVPFAPLSNYQFRENAIDKEKGYTLSRFAYMRKDETGKLVIESPMGRAKVVIHHPVSTTLFTAFAQTHTVAAAIATLPELPATIGMEFATLLVNAAVIAPVDSEGRLVEETDTIMPQWEFPDLIFHKHIRMGRKEQPYGRTLRFQGKLPPPPLEKANLPETIIPLKQVDLEHLTQNDLSFTAVIEARRSIRDYSDTPMTLEQLGEFLYRVAAVRKVLTSGDQQRVFTRRPYPSGGALYELEIYPIISQCTGLEPGLYYYNPFAHQLHFISPRNAYVDTLLETAWISADRHSRPQVLLSLTAHFQSVQWRYESVAYALIMKHVGVMKQTMYLVATAMGLAPCALGGGNSDIFAAAAGLNTYVETSVGEFLLGSKPS